MSGRSIAHEAQGGDPSPEARTEPSAASATYLREEAEKKADEKGELECEKGNTRYEIRSRSRYPLTKRAQLRSCTHTPFSGPASDALADVSICCNTHPLHAAASTGSISHLSFGAGTAPLRVEAEAEETEGEGEGLPKPVGAGRVAGAAPGASSSTAMTQTPRC